MVLTTFLRTRLCSISRSGATKLPLIQRTSISSSSRSLSTQTLSTLNQSDVQLHGTTLTSLRDVMMQDDESRCALAYCLTFSIDQNDFQRNFERLDSIMRQQLQYNKLYQSGNQSNVMPTTTTTTTQSTKKQQSIDTAPLPRTLEDALRPTKSRSIVITEANKPYRIVSVNTCWEQLCGYSSVESNGKTLGSLLRGPQTDPLAATTIIAKLLQGETDVGATLINYTKDKRPFYNRIRAGPIYNDLGQVTHFVGVLQELTAYQNNNNVSTIQQQMFM